MGQILGKLLDVFFTKKLDMVVIGLENSGKTTLLSALAHGQPVETVPTIGLNVKVFQKGRVQMKCWDIGGQAQYRTEWSRYCKGCDVVLFVVDAAAPQKLATAKKELHKLLDDGSIGSTPLLVLANKIDIQPHVGESELIEKLQLNYVMETPWMVLPISALQLTNLDQVVEWLTAQGKN
ncbi:MAG: GTP-binding protein [Desulfobacteraceae bacterium]|jgi:ADP-ribosylation factor-like protein 8|nr:GTP-binding protein [Desulfobacteraceae bacterium]